MIEIIAAFSLVLELLRELDSFIIINVILALSSITLAFEQPKVFSFKWFLIGFFCFSIIFLNLGTFLTWTWSKKLTRS